MYLTFLSNRMGTNGRNITALANPVWSMEAAGMMMMSLGREA